jgi:hypothetical protein
MLIDKVDPFFTLNCLSYAFPLKFQLSYSKQQKWIPVLSEGQETGAITPAPENARKKI